MSKVNTSRPDGKSGRYFALLYGCDFAGLAEDTGCEAPVNGHGIGEQLGGCNLNQGSIPLVQISMAEHKHPVTVKGGIGIGDEYHPAPVGCDGFRQILLHLQSHSLPCLSDDIRDSRSDKEVLTIKHCEFL